MRTLTCRRSLARLSILAGMMVALAATAAPATAQGPGLPRTYDIQRIDSPSPILAGGFGLVTAPVGDVNGDGKDDFATNQTEGTPNNEGRIWVYGGANGTLLGSFDAPDPGNAGSAANNNRALVDRWIDRLGDLGSCPANTPAGQTCTSPTVGPADGRADFLVGAEGVDVATPGATPSLVRDAGRVYVIDGRTLSVLKKIDMPGADRLLLSQRQAQFPLPATNARGGFGRTAITPRGLPVCAGNGGVVPCPTTTEIPQPVRIGDMDGAGQPDIVIGANRFPEIGSTAQPGSHCAAQADPNGICLDAGRAYVYRGEDIAGSNPATILETPLRTIRNPGAQSDANDTTFTRSEIFSHAQFPIGDVGQCRSGGAFPVISPGEKCSTLARTNVPDGKPDVVISAHRGDAPLFNPDPSRFEEGFSFLIDGATGAYLHIYHHPEPQPNALFGYTTRQSFPLGDMGATALPDLVQGAFQNAQNKPQAGKLYLTNGDFNAAFPIMQILQDPTPTTNERFGIAREGVGDLVPGNTGKEMLVGVFPGGNLGPDAFTDLHFINALSGEELQRISDPEQQLQSSFGYQVTPLGDLNDDGFQDFATSAPNWDSPDAGGAAGIRDQGRIYVYRSDNAPLPATGGGDGTTPPGGGSTPPPGSTTPGSIPGCASGKNLLQLTDGNDIRNGTAGEDLIFAGAGNDIIDALAGDDCVDLGPGNDRGQGGAGNDLVLGGDGDDRVVGNDGNDRLRGGPGVDSVLGGLGNDTLDGQSGNDRLDGSRGRDRMHGGSGNDKISAGSGADRVSGDAGNDRISGGSSNDVLAGGSGNDVISGGTGRDRISCGSGKDSVIADGRDVVARDCERVRRRR